MKKSILILIIIAIIIYLGIRFNKQAQVISPLADDNDTFSLMGIFQKKPKDLNDVIDQIKPIIDKQTGSYSVYIYDLKTKKTAGIHETIAYIGASLNKVPILAVLYYQAQSGQINLDERITVQSSDIQDYGTGIIRNEGPGGVYSLRTLAQLMMEKSDNTAAYILSNKIGVDQIQELINSWGMIQTDMTNNKISNKDLAQLFIKMYEGQITNQALTIEMMDLMIDSDFENRLPKLLPKNIKIYHKIGTEIGNIHDVGIIEIPNHPYYLGILTADINDETVTEDTIAQISKTVYDFMKD